MSDHRKSASPPGGDDWPLAGLLVLGGAVLSVVGGLTLLIGVATVPGWHQAGLDLAAAVIGLVPVKPDAEAALATMLYKIALLCLALLPVMILEAALGGWRNSSFARLVPRRRSTSASYDLLSFLLNIAGFWKFVVLLFTLGGMAVIGVALAQLSATMAAHGLRVETGSVAADIAIGFLIFTFTDYWSHRVFHMRSFWPLHRMHHSATEMTALTVWRNHPTAPAIEAFFKIWPFALYGGPPQAVTIVALSVLAYQHLIHANLLWHWGWFGRWILMPPAAHRLHHCDDPELYGRNLGIPVIWDRLFGTWADPRLASAGMRLGVGDAVTNTGRPHLEAWSDLQQWLRGALAGLGRRLRGQREQVTISD